MGQSMGGNTGKTIATTAMAGAAGGLNAASGTTPPQQPPIDFSGVGAAIKKARGPKTVSLNNPTSVIPQNPDLAAPDMNAPASPMPDLYSGTNAQIPQLRKPINGMLPFYGQ